MSNDYIPAKDADFINWSANFSTLITAAPGTYGLTAPDAVAIAAADASWAAAYTLAVDPATRTPATVADKDVERANAETVERPYAMTINADPAVTDLARVSLGLTVRTVHPTPASTPTDVPLLNLRSQQAASMEISIRATATPTSRARPAGCDGCQLIVEKETTPYSGVWEFQEAVQILDDPAWFIAPAGTIGASMRMSGRWFNKAKLNGVASFGPVSAYLPFTSTAP